MGAKLEFNMVFSDLVDFRSIIEKCLKFQHFNILRMDVIDSWEWDNHNSIFSVNDIPNLLAMGKIVIVHGVLNNCNTGFSIEPFNNEFIYSIWIDISHDFSMELQIKTSPPSWIMLACKEIIKQHKTNCKFIAVGTETIMHYGDNINDCMKNSHNVDLWIINKDLTHISETEHRKMVLQHKGTVLLGTLTDE